MNVSKLDLEKDKTYIIHQVLSYGTLDEIRWLMGVYGKKTVREIFLSQPMKVYSPPAFKLSQVLLGVPEARDYRYDQTLPRRLG